MVKIIIISNNHTARAGIRSILENEADFLVIGEATNGQGGLDLLKRTRPDILVTDMLLKDMNGDEFCQKARGVKPSTECMIFSFIEGALQSAARAYVLKENGNVELVKAIRTVLSGKVLSPALSRK
jgi:DNA-binding NarL/FixJ family response regulator